MNLCMFNKIRIILSNSFSSTFHRAKSVHMRSFFWSVFSRIRTEYGEIDFISPYSVRMRENTDQKKPRIWTIFKQWFYATGLLSLHWSHDKMKGTLTQIWNEELQISLHVCVHIKTITWKFRCLNPKNSQVIYSKIYFVNIIKKLWFFTGPCARAKTIWSKFSKN